MVSGIDSENERWEREARETDTGKRWGEEGRGDPTKREGDTMVAETIDGLEPVDVQGRSKKAGGKEESERLERIGSEVTGGHVPWMPYRV